ncbi:MAG: helix-turn-helix transcriptional regulator [Lamprobacter sp.]|uniref:helix-turn-helix transcriptional regulator n=1 Tax=Lamprobacter sp. TaxID=3100796 RepID=UPI002B25FF5A|nr:helix-turn-helix transcriptional regulator [Lamprobacter sp.]MEA3642771.1 helix-turn-helix transcriptional regulator [Lamprobacter sp.]
MSEFHPATRSIEVSPGESVRILRELQGLSQTELALRAGLPLAALVAIEAERSPLDIEQAKSLARTLKCHPGALAFPAWDIKQESAA